MSVHQKTKPSKKCVGPSHIKPILNVRRKLQDLTRFIFWKSSSNKQQMYVKNMNVK